MLLPPSTNADYRGSMIAVWALGLLSLLIIGPAFIHMFLPDGGAGVIAGLDMGTGRRTIIATFAWAGATQLVHGLAMLIVAIRYRSFTALFLVLDLIQRVLFALNDWVLKTPGPGHRPPEHFANLVNLAVILIVLPLALRTRRSATA